MITAAGLIQKNKDALKFFFNTLSFVDLSKVRLKVLLQTTEEIKLSIAISDYKNIILSDYTIFDSKYDKNLGYDEFDGFKNDFLNFIENRINEAFKEDKENAQYQAERA